MVKFCSRTENDALFSNTTRQLKCNDILLRMSILKIVFYKFISRQNVPVKKNWQLEKNIYLLHFFGRDRSDNFQFEIDANEISYSIYVLTIRIQ